MERHQKRTMRRRRKNKITGGEMRQQYCFTLLPTVMDRVEKEASKNRISVSLQVNSILKERYENKET